MIQTSTAIFFSPADGGWKVPSADTLSSPSSCCDTWQQRSCSSLSSSSSCRAPQMSTDKHRQTQKLSIQGITLTSEETTYPVAWHTWRWVCLTSLLTRDPHASCSKPRSELELAPSELMSALSPLDSRLVWMASRSSSFTMGVKLVKSSRVSVPGGERQGTRAEQLMSASEGPECCSIILETQEETDY